jgi:hypothetical protein
VGARLVTLKISRKQGRSGLIVKDISAVPNTLPQASVFERPLSRLLTNLLFWAPSVFRHPGGVPGLFRSILKTYPTPLLERRGNWMTAIQEYDLDFKPSKIVRGQGLCKLAV